MPWDKAERQQRRGRAEFSTSVVKEETFLVWTTGSTSHFAHLPKEKFITVPLPVPEPTEQAAIAEALTDFDSEIAALENRRDKTRLLKQGMMQELLTGRTRLV